MAHQRQGRIGRVEHRAAGRPSLLGEVDDQPDILAQ